MKKRSLLFVNIILVISLIMPVIITGCEMNDNQTTSNQLQGDKDNKNQENYNNGQQTTVNSPNVNKDGNEGEKGQYKDAEEEVESIDTGTVTNLGNSLLSDTPKGINSEISSSIEEQKDTDLFIQIYYQDIEGLVIPVTRRIPRQLSVAKSAINGLIDTPINRESMSYYGLIPILPNGTEFTINIKERTAIIDFNNKILEYNSSISEQNIVSSIVYTLTQFESIDKVKILINGYEQKELKFGTDLSGELSREDVLINPSEPGRVNLKEGMQKGDIYLLKYLREAENSKNNGNGEGNKDGEVLYVPVSIEFKNKDTDRERMIERIIEQLSTYSNNNRENRLFSALDESVIVNKCRIEGDLLILDLSIDLANYGGTYSEYLLVGQVMHSMKQFRELEKISILVDGNAISLPEGIDFSRPVKFPYVINDIFSDEKYY